MDGVVDTNLCYSSGYDCWLDARMSASRSERRRRKAGEMLDEINDICCGLLKQYGQ